MRSRSLRGIIFIDIKKGELCCYSDVSIHSYKESCIVFFIRRPTTQMEKEKEQEKEFDNKTVFNEKIIVGTRVIAVMRNVGIMLKTKKSYDSLKIKDVEANVSIKLNNDVLEAVKKAIAVKVD